MTESQAILPAGKLPLALLETLLARIPHGDARVLVGPRAGVDAAVIDFGDRLLVAKTDPITFATAEIGWYAVNVNANDLAVMGATPRWFLATALLPAGLATPALAQAIFTQLTDACAALGISLVGGHTEITVGLDRPIISGTMLGEATRDGFITAAGAQPGDALLLVKPAPIEGAALIALERAEILRTRGYTDEFIRRAQGFLRDPGISVVAPARIALAAGGIHAMHDPTEGGVCTGLLEIGRAAAAGLRVDLDAIPLLPQGAQLCREFGLDPLGLIASGSLLVAVAAEAVPNVCAALAAAGFPAAVIGAVTPEAEGLVARRGGQPVPWPTFPADEITKLFV